MSDTLQHLQWVLSVSHKAKLAHLLVSFLSTSFNTARWSCHRWRYAVSQNVDKYSCQRSSSYKLDWITTGRGRIGDCLELEDTVWQTRWTPCGEVDPIQARVLLGYKWQNDTWTLRTLLPSLPTPAGISSLKWPKNRSTWITFMIIYKIWLAVTNRNEIYNLTQTYFI